MTRMNNKVLIKLILPEINKKYDLFIPVNEYIWKINKLMVRSINSLDGEILDVEKEYAIINKDTGKIYQNNEIIVNTEIRNGTELILITNQNKGELEVDEVIPTEKNVN